MGDKPVASAHKGAPAATGAKGPAGAQASAGAKPKAAPKTKKAPRGKDRMGLIVDVSTILSSTKTRVSSLNARSTPDGFALIEIGLEVSDHKQLQTVIHRLQQISGVMRVTRPAG